MRKQSIFGNKDLRATAHTQPILRSKDLRATAHTQPILRSKDLRATAYTQPLGVRFVKNEVTVLGGQYGGIACSGRAFTVSGDGVIRVPINYDGNTVQGAVLYFDGSTRQFVQVGADGVGSNVEHSPDPDFDIGESAWDFVHPSWSFSNGEAIHTGEESYFQANTLTVDRSYKAVYNVTQTDSLNFPQCYMFGLTTAMTTPGIHEFSGITTDGLINTRGTGDCRITSLSVVEILPENNTYDLTEGTYGTICVLETNAFTVEDIDAFNKEPELLLEWYWGTKAIPSGLVRGSGDKLFYPADSVYVELSYQLSAELGDDTSFDTTWATSGESISNGDGQVHIISTDGSFSMAAIYRETFYTGLYLVSVNADYTTGGVSLNTGVAGFNLNIKNSGITSRYINHSGDGTKIEFSRLFITDAILYDYSIKQVLSDYITVEGTYSYTAEADYGIQDMRLELRDKLPVGIAPSGSVYGRGKIETGFKLLPPWCVEETIDTHVLAWTSEGAMFKDGLPYNYFNVPTGNLVLTDKTFDNTPVGLRSKTRVWTMIPDEYVTKNARSGKPLEDHTRWYLLGTTSTNVGWDDFGYKIVVDTTDPGTPAALVFGDETAPYSFETCVWECNINIDATNGTNYFFPIVRFKDEGNFVGLRLVNGNVEIQQKINGSWQSPVSHTASTGKWEVQFFDNTLKLYIDNVFICEEPHNMQGVCTYGISANRWENGDNEVIMSDYRVSDTPHWWDIDEADIIGAWDFGWDGHYTEESARTDLINGHVFSIREGSPTIRLGDCYNFGGAGAAEVSLPEYNWNEVSVIVQFYDWVQNGTLDAIFSHYKDNNRYCLQQDFDASPAVVRWCCGDNSATTVNVDGVINAGVYGTSGNKLYKDGVYLDEMNVTGPTVATQKFILGALETTTITQLSRVRVQKLLIVKRRLTEDEHANIYLNMSNAEGASDDSGSVLVDDSGNIITI